MKHQRLSTNLTFIGPFIVIYSYSKTNKMHLFLKLFILVKHSARFGRSFCLSSGAQYCTHGDRRVPIICCYLLLAGMRWNCRTLYMLRTVFPSIIRSSRLHIQRQACVNQLLLVGMRWNCSSTSSPLAAGSSS
jgi:hypothetical protein